MIKGKYGHPKLEPQQTPKYNKQQLIKTMPNRLAIDPKLKRCLVRGIKF